MNTGLSRTEIMRSFRDTPGLYIHVPFCRQFCPFCPYNKIIFEPTKAAGFFAALTREAGAYQELMQAPFHSLYIGGGTPTLCVDELSRLLPRVDIANEIAIEVLPNHATRECLSRLREIGINYLSLGIQSFDQGMLDYLNRPNSAADNDAALTNAAGLFDCVDIDLIFDVSFRDQNVFFSDLRRCFEAGVDQVSTYPLMRFGYTPFGKAGHDPKAEHACLARATDLAENYGYERRSIWTFNKRSAPNYSSITREFYLGLGAGAATFAGSLFVVNHFSVSRYCDAIENRHLPVARYIRLSDFRAAAYYLFWQVYTGRVDLGRFRKLYPRAAMLRRIVGVLKRTGYFSREGDFLRLTQRGYDAYHDLERWVTYQFIEPLWREMIAEHHRQDLPARQGGGVLRKLGLGLTGIRQAGTVALSS